MTCRRAIRVQFRIDLNATAGMGNHLRFATGQDQREQAIIEPVFTTGDGQAVRATHPMPMTVPGYRRIPVSTCDVTDARL